MGRGRPSPRDIILARPLHRASRRALLVIYGWVFDLTRANATEAQSNPKTRYLGTVTKAGARKSG